MGPDGGDRNFCQHKGGAPELRRADAAEGIACKALQARLEALRLVCHAVFKRCGPIALDEIVAAVKQQEPCIIQMEAYPGWCVKRGGEPVAGFDGRDETFLIGEHGGQPQLAEQRVARGEAVVEGALWRFQVLGDRLDRHGGGTPFGGQRAGRRKEARIIEQRSPHICRLYGLDLPVNMWQCLTNRWNGGSPCPLRVTRLMWPT